MKVKDIYFRHRRIILVVLLLFTIAELALVPFNASATELSKLPLFAILLLVSEVSFVIGLLFMALAVEHDLGPNPLKWRKQLKHLIQHMTDDRKFWFGFWLNMIGALATGFIVLLGILFVLPKESWGVLWLPIADIVITLLLRATILEIRNEVASKSSNFQ